MSTTHVDKRLHIALLAFLLMLTALTTYRPIYPNEQFLQHIGTALLMGLIVADMRQHKLGITALTGLTLFTGLHIIGARWIYSYVPYASWAEHLHLPFELTTERNHYDRLVHFSFGLLLFPFFYDRIRALTHQRLWAISGAWLCIQTGSLVYERTHARTLAQRRGRIQWPARRYVGCSKRHGTGLSGIHMDCHCL